MGKFSDQIKNRTEAYSRRIRAASRKAIELTVNDMMTLRSQGGRLRLDTGFLANSAGAGVGQIPTGPRESPGGTITTQLTGLPLAVALLQWQPGQTFYWGFTSNYARYRESEDGFVRGAAEKWPRFVREAAADAKARIK